MDFYKPPRRKPAEAFVPMINVVFLLLIFFLMTAQIAPQDPFELTPPEAETDNAADGAELFLSPEGAFAFAGQEGESAIAAAMGAAGDGALRLRADGAMDAAALARALRRLREAGAGEIALVTRPAAAGR